jgi:glycosyltransferase involved in cell wall biosynthesis
MTIWFDVTTILAWRRPPTGVVRVEAEVFKRLAADAAAGVRFCGYEKDTSRFVEHAADEVRAARARNGGSPRATSGGPSGVRRLVDGANALLRRAPVPVYRRIAGLKKASAPVLRTALHRLRETAATLERRRRAPAVARGAAPAAPFARGDVLVSLGLDWDFKDLPGLYRLKQATGLKVVLCCYDLIPVLLPHACRAEVADVFPRYYADVAWVADHVVCISRSSQADFERYVDAISAPKPPTSVITLGSTLDAPTGAPAEAPVTGRYVLFVSTIERRKNHEVLYRALVRLAEQGRAELPTLVFVGMRGWGVDDLMNDLKRDPRVRGKVVHLEHVTDAQLTALYAGAAFTVFPSLYEGWGLPVAESLAHGKFCLSSNTSSLPEVGGDLVEALDPWDVQAWAQRLAFYVDHPEALAEKERDIATRFVPTPWEQTARAVLEIGRAHV